MKDYYSEGSQRQTCLSREERGNTSRKAPILGRPSPFSQAEVMHKVCTHLYSILSGMTFHAALLTVAQISQNLLYSHGIVALFLVVCFDL
jgi:hypothetical protein